MTEKEIYGLVFVVIIGFMGLSPLLYLFIVESDIREKIESLFESKSEKKFKKDCKQSASYKLTAFKSYSKRTKIEAGYQDAFNMKKNEPGLCWGSANSGWPKNEIYLQEIILSEKLSLKIYWKNLVNHEGSKIMYVVNRKTKEVICNCVKNWEYESRKYISLGDFSNCRWRYELFALVEKAYKKEQNEKYETIDINLKDEVFYSTDNILELAKQFPELTKAVDTIVDSYNEKSLPMTLQKRMTNYYLPELENMLSKYGQERDIRYKNQILDFAMIIKNGVEIEDKQNAQVICNTFAHIMRMDKLL